MKEKDLYVDFEPQMLVYYVEKDDDTYGQVISGSHLSANYLDDFRAKRKSLEENLRKKMMNNEISPLFYYMTLQEIGPKDMAGRIGMFQWQMKRAYKPKYFSKLSVEKLRRMAEVFNIPVANLFQTFVIRDADREKLILEQAGTHNNLFHITKVSIR